MPAAAPGELRVCGFTLLGEDWQAIDTPGSIEFLHVATDALLAADAAVICVGPDPAAAVLASPYLQAVEAAGTPAILFVNRIDEATGRVRDIIAAAEAELSGNGRLVIRPSGTEPVIRVMAEGDDAAQVEAVVDRICDAVRAAA